IAPVRRREESVLLDVAQTVIQLDYAIRDARVMARVAWRLTETGYPLGARLELSMLEFASAVRALEGHLEGAFDETLAARAAAVRATRIAAAATPPEDDLVFAHLVGQIRSTTVDLLRATGLPRDQAITAMLAGVSEGRGDAGGSR
ncbi:MAG: rane protein-like protein, partial [Thermoleophilia bacterium]|nr:rane protein-like protein [Thermoleophilia bacterium]